MTVEWARTSGLYKTKPYLKMSLVFHMTELRTSLTGNLSRALEPMIRQAHIIVFKEKWHPTIMYLSK